MSAPVLQRHGLVGKLGERRNAGKRDMPGPQLLARLLLLLFFLVR
jgi:hypothetical protein